MKTNSFIIAALSLSLTSSLALAEDAKPTAPIPAAEAERSTSVPAEPQAPSSAPVPAAKPSLGKPSLGKPSLETQSKLLKAVKAKDYAGIKTLLASGANPTLPVQMEMPPFLQAVDNQDMEAVKIFLEAKANPEFSFGPVGSTPLMIAAEKSNFALFSLLQQHGAKLDAKNLNGMSVLGYAFTGFLNPTRLEDREKIIKTIQESGWTESAKLGAAPFADKDKPEELGKGPGAEVGRFVIGSAAENLKLAPGDVIMSVDETPIQNFKHLMTVLSEKKALDPVKLTVRRKNETLTLAGQVGPAVVGPFR